MKIFSLNTVNLKNEVIIHSLNCSGHIRRRLLDLGLCNGTKIIPIFKSLTCDSTAYLIRGSTIALRNEDAENIYVTICD